MTVFDLRRPESSFGEDSDEEVDIVTKELVDDVLSRVYDVSTIDHMSFRGENMELEAFQSIPKTVKGLSFQQDLVLTEKEIGSIPPTLEYLKYTPDNDLSISPQRSQVSH